MTIQAQILELLKDLKQRLGMAILLITHHLGIVAEVADRVAVMYAGQVVETAPARQLLERPLHPYTRALLASVPRLNQPHKALTGIPGTVPDLANLPPGSRFAPRCGIARPECSQGVPAMLDVDSFRAVRCPFYDAVPEHVTQATIKT